MFVIASRDRSRRFVLFRAKLVSRCPITPIRDENVKAVAVSVDHPPDVRGHLRRTERDIFAPSAATQLALRPTPMSQNPRFVTKPSRFLQVFRVCAM
jgi:hypothetical protein